MNLVIELVPRPLWGYNPRKLMGDTNWDIVRRETYKAYNYQCGICNAKGRMEAHEIWEYDDDLFIQKLVGLIALCQSCHRIKHIGMSQATLDNKILDQLGQHFITVNNCTVQEYNQHITEAFAKWRIRSLHTNWTLDWGPYQELING